MTYEECLKSLADLGHELHGMTFGLDAIHSIMEELGRPETRYPTVIVAGTNGKGSTCSILASILRLAGYRTGLYTSPHLVRVNERIRVDGEEISNSDFAAAFSDVAGAMDKLLAEGKLEKKPSFFEFLTATAFHHFARAAAEFVVLEVGMGGRLDATNITSPRIAVITNIDYDHMEFLGSTLEAIAGEKAGIISPGRPVISNVENGEAAAVIRARAAQAGSELLDLAREAKISNLKARQGRYSFDLKMGDERFARLTSPFLGGFQVNNATAAVAAAWELKRQGFNITRRSIVQGLRAAVWPGRLESISTKPLVLLDGAHNPGGARELAAFIKQDLPGRKVRLVYASMRDKAIVEISSILFPLASEIFLTRPTHPRAATPDEILALLDAKPEDLHIEPDPLRAFAQAVESSAARDVVLVAGSLFLVGEIEKAYKEGKLSFLRRAGSAVLR